MTTEVSIGMPERSRSQECRWRLDAFSTRGCIQARITSEMWSGSVECGTGCGFHPINAEKFLWNAAVSLRSSMTTSGAVRFEGRHVEDTSGYSQAPATVCTGTIDIRRRVSDDKDL